EIKSTAFRVTRVGELIGREVAARLGVSFGIVDLSLAPTPQVGDSVGEILQAMGVVRIGAPGSTAALALLNDAVKKGGSFASSSVGGLSGAFVAVSEDAALARAVEAGDLTLAKLEAMTAVCSVGLDMIAVPGETDAETLAALIADKVAIGVINHKTTAVRIIPVPGKGAGNRALFGGLFWRDCHPPHPRRGRLDAFRPSRRPHPRTAFQPSKLKKPKNLWKKCGRSLHSSRPKRIGRTCTDSTQSISGGWSHDDANTDRTHDWHRGAGR